MSSPDEFDRALTDALQRRAAGVHPPDDGRTRFEDHLAADTRHRHRRHVTMSVLGVVAVVAVGAAAIAFATGRDPQPTQTVAIAAAPDQLKLRAPSGPSGLPKLLPTLAEGWVLESAGDYGPPDMQGSALPDIGTIRTMVYRSDGGAIRVEIRTDPKVDAFQVGGNGDPTANAVVVHGQPAVLTVGSTTLPDVSTLMWGEGEHTLVTVSTRGVTPDELLAFGESLQPSAEGWSASSLPAGFDLVFDGDADAAMGYGGPSWQLGYRGPEDLSQPQDPSIQVSATKGSADAVAAFPGPGDHPAAVSIGTSQGILLTSTDASPYRTLVWFDDDSGLVLTVNGAGVSESDLLAFASTLHPVSDDEWQRTVADVLPKPDEPTGPVEPEAPTQPLALPGLATGTLPDGRPWTIDGTQYRDPPDDNLLCGNLSVGSSDDAVAVGVCANPDGTPGPQPSVGTDGERLVIGPTPADIASVTVELTGEAPVTVPTVASSDQSITARWFVADVGNTEKVSAVVGRDAGGRVVSRIDQPLGPPVPDFAALDAAPKREVGSGTVDGAQWTLTAADAPLSDGSGAVTCATLTFATETSQTCPIKAIGGVNGPGILEVIPAVLRDRIFVLASLEPGVAKLVVDLDDGTQVGANAIDTRSASGTSVAVVYVPSGRTAMTLHAWDDKGNDLGPVDMSVVNVGPHPTAFAADTHR